ncbi:hypothetical protein AX16_004206 [Volvariella volvacea WC 439]|nr:hypothetical protein AX16_004206 [Volvariella volvacea WC 439]
MAPTLSLFKSHPKQLPQPPHSPPPTRPSVQMPTVLVTPPEEEQTPTWCCFEGSPAPPSPTPDESNPQIPSALPTVDEVSPAPRHAVEVNDLPPVPESSQPSPPSRKEAAGDSEIAEVVKLKRGNGESNTPKGKGLKARASRAFRSIRKSGKGSPEKVDEQDVFAAPSEDGGVPNSFYNSAITPSLSRRSSFGLSQIFQSSKSRSNAPNLSPYGNPSYSSTVPSLNFMNAEHIYPPEPGDELDRIRCDSPTPSSRTRRFSLFSLQKIFSFSQAGAAVAAVSTSTSASTSNPELDSSDSISPRSLPSLSRDSSGPSTISSQSGPSTPTDDRSEDGERRDGKEDDDEDSRNTITSKVSREDDGPPLLMQELSFEIRLDSLHFEALSFNPDDF